MTRHLLRPVHGLLGAWILFLPLPSFGQTTASHAPPNTANTKRIEGTVARVDGNEFLLQVSGGTTETYQLSPAVQIIRSRPGLMSDLSAGKMVSCTSLNDQGAQLVAGECHIFSENMPAAADAQGATSPPHTSTVNGTITDVRDATGAVNAKGRRIVIQISSTGPPTAMAVFSLTKITVVRPGDASALKPGVQVRGISQQAVDGTGVIQTLTIMSAAPAKGAEPVGAVLP
jgi:hypothetical protein